MDGGRVTEVHQGDKLEGQWSSSDPKDVPSQLQLHRMHGSQTTHTHNVSNDGTTSRPIARPKPSGQDIPVSNLHYLSKPGMFPSAIYSCCSAAQLYNEFGFINDRTHDSQREQASSTIFHYVQAPQYEMAGPPRPGVTMRHSTREDHDQTLYLDTVPHVLQSLQARADICPLATMIPHADETGDWHALRRPLSQQRRRSGRFFIKENTMEQPSQHSAFDHEEVTEDVVQNQDGNHSDCLDMVTPMKPWQPQAQAQAQTQYDPSSPAPPSDLAFTSIEAAREQAFSRVHFMIDNDNWVSIKNDANRQFFIVRALKTAFEGDFAPYPPDPRRQSAADTTEWTRWQGEHHARVVAITHKPTCRHLAEKAAWLLLGEALETHEFGYRASTYSLNKTMNCGKRLSLCRDVITAYPIVALDVLNFTNHHEFVANPQAYLNRKIANMWGNWEKKKAKLRLGSVTAKKGRAASTLNTISAPMRRQGVGVEESKERIMAKGMEKVEDAAQDDGIFQTLEPTEPESRFWYPKAKPEVGDESLDPMLSAPTPCELTSHQASPQSGGKRSTTDTFGLSNAVGAIREDESEVARPGKRLKISHE